MGRRLIRVLRTWLLPARHLEALSGWLQLLSAAAVLLLPSAAAGAIAGYLSTGRLGRVTALLVLLAVGLGLALFALWRLLPDPQLALRASAENGVEVPTAYPNNVVVRGIYFHVEVRNVSNRPLEGVRAELIRVQQRDDLTSEYRDDVRFGTPMAPLPLKWAHEPPERLQVAVDPDVPRRLDFISNEEFLGGRAIIMTPDHALRGMATQLTAGTYRLTVRARGAEAAPVDGVFEVFVGGTWNDISVRDAP